ncbi:hypothetical protein [Nocardia sp. NPDC052566]|uniref:hypothetical protein n=1 Tax=Nocardia sp. NPDC052566 TaxID=3364330 RepID=UPI0037C65C2E
MNTIMRRAAMGLAALAIAGGTTAAIAPTAHARPARCITINFGVGGWVQCPHTPESGRYYVIIHCGPPFSFGLGNYDLSGTPADYGDPVWLLSGSFAYCNPGDTVTAVWYDFLD